MLSMNRLITSIACVLLSIAIVASAAAQDSTQTGLNAQWLDKEQPDIHEFSVLGGYSPRSTKGFWGKTPEATMQLLAMRYNRKLLKLRGSELLEYVIELNIRADYYNPAVNQDVSPGNFTGFGISPIGFQYNFRTDAILQPFLKSSVGFLYLDNPFPDDRGKKFNFMLEAGTGVEFQITKFSSFTVGYKYHHMSNGQIGQINPGIDSNVFYGALTFF